MKGLSSKLLILILGIAVATAIAMAALLFNNKLSAVFSVIPRPQRPPVHGPSTSALKAALEKIELTK